MHLHLNPEANVTYYNVVVDTMAPVSVTPAADGSADYGLDSFAPGDHAVTAQACDASGCSAFMTALPFTIPQPIPDVPTGDIVSP